MRSDFVAIGCYVADEQRERYTNGDQRFDLLRIGRIKARDEPYINISRFMILYLNVKSSNNRQTVN